jgi:hypothetical protein
VSRSYPTGTLKAGRPRKLAMGTKRMILYTSLVFDSPGRYGLRVPSKWAE